ncbi:MAG: response regulator [Patescibacteria group bacterium]
MNGPIKILAIEDDEFIRILLMDIFWIHGVKDNLQLLLASNISEARDILNREKPALIILDMMLPEKEEEPLNKLAGCKFLEELKKNSRTRDIKILVFSGFDDKELKEKAMKLGADKFLVKGEHMPKELLDSIKELINI